MNEDVLSSPIWYNPRISKSVLFFPLWYKNGIVTVSDIVNKNGYILEPEEIKKKYHLSKINFLDFFRIKILITKFLKKFKTGDDFDFLQPCIMKNVRFLLLNKTGTKGIYRKVNTCATLVEMEFQRKWHHDLAIQLPRASWQHKFRICFKTINDPFYKWFQYRIIHRILGTQELLCKMGLSDSPTCLLCGENVETLLHMYVLCKKSKILWSKLENHIKEKTVFEVKFSPEDILLGYNHSNPNSVALNTVIIVTKSYIYATSRKRQELNMHDMFIVLQKTYDEQKLVASLEMQNEKFEKSWHQIKRIF